MNILFKKLHQDAIIPSYAHEGDSGFDLYSIEDAKVEPGKIAMLDTGLAVQLPTSKQIPIDDLYMLTLTFEMQIRPKSGRAAKEGLIIVNTPGTIDSIYRGAIKVIMTTLGRKPIFINKGEKIAQGVIVPVLCSPEVRIVETTELTETLRGEGGFGSTGV